LYEEALAIKTITAHDHSGASVTRNFHPDAAFASGVGAGLHLSAHPAEVALAGEHRQLESILFDDVGEREDRRGDVSGQGTEGPSPRAGGTDGEVSPAERKDVMCHQDTGSIQRGRSDFLIGQKQPLMRGASPFPADQVSVEDRAARKEGAEGKNLRKEPRQISSPPAFDDQSLFA